MGEFNDAKFRIHIEVEDEMDVRILTRIVNDYRDGLLGKQHGLLRPYGEPNGDVRLYNNIGGYLEVDTISTSDLVAKCRERKVFWDSRDVYPAQIIHDLLMNGSNTE